MPLAELLLPEFDDEMAATRRVLERVPEANFAWKPHPKSMTLGRLATLLAELPSWAVNAVEKDEFDFAPPGSPPFHPHTLENRARILALFDQNVQAARRAAGATSDAEFAKPWALKAGGRVLWTKTKLAVYRETVMNHLVHHRGQLTVYLRLNDVPVPAIYGPTADERGY
ncbi:MAG TPA: DinB family protein [Gemmatimonadales bacterium]|nr:DinB family protein [Gemmatimonadales bacterium]